MPHCQSPRHPAINERPVAASLLTPMNGKPGTLKSATDLGSRDQDPSEHRSFARQSAGTLITAANQGAGGKVAVWQPDLERIRLDAIKAMCWLSLLLLTSSASVAGVAVWGSHPTIMTGLMSSALALVLFPTLNSYPAALAWRRPTCLVTDETGFGITAWKARGKLLPLLSEWGAYSATWAEVVGFCYQPSTRTLLVDLDDGRKLHLNLCGHSKQVRQELVELIRMRIQGGTERRRWGRYLADLLIDRKVQRYFRPAPAFAAGSVTLGREEPDGGHTD
jgi:hypothetical protein